MEPMGVEDARHALDQLLHVLPARCGETDDAEATPGMRFDPQRQLACDELSFRLRGGLDGDLNRHDPFPSWSGRASAEPALIGPTAEARPPQRGGLAARLAA